MNRLQELLHHPPISIMKPLGMCPDLGDKPIITINYVEWEKQILSAVEEMLPKEDKDVEKYTNVDMRNYGRGYNKAIAEMRKRLKGSK